MCKNQRDSKSIPPLENDKLEEKRKRFKLNEEIVRKGVEWIELRSTLEFVAYYPFPFQATFHCRGPTVEHLSQNLSLLLLFILLIKDDEKVK